MRLFRYSSCALLLAVGFVIPAQSQSAWQPGHADLGFGEPHSKQWVQMISPEVLSIRPGTRQLALRFAIQPGLHINSHTPHSTYLIPTTLTFDPSTGIRMGKLEYPLASEYHFFFSSQEALSVYTGEFSVRAQLQIQRGHSTLHGQLKYQACDNRTCNPPQTLPVTLSITAE